MPCICYRQDNTDVVYYLTRDSNNIPYMLLDTLIVVGRVNRYKGTGTRILIEIIELAKAQGCHYIELKADTKQPQAKGFILTEWYKKFGFEQLEQKGWMVKMRKHLTLTTTNSTLA